MEFICPNVVSTVSWCVVVVVFATHFSLCSQQRSNHYNEWSLQWNSLHPKVDMLHRCSKTKCLLKWEKIICYDLLVGQCSRGKSNCSNRTIGCCPIVTGVSVVRDLAALPSAESGEASQMALLFTSCNLAGLRSCVNTPSHLQSIFIDNINHIQNMS